MHTHLIIQGRLPWRLQSSIVLVLTHSPLCASEVRSLCLYPFDWVYSPFGFLSKYFFLLACYVVNLKANELLHTNHICRKTSFIVFPLIDIRSRRLLSQRAVCSRNIAMGRTRCRNLPTACVTSPSSGTEPDVASTARRASTAASCIDNTSTRCSSRTPSRAAALQRCGRK
jgi:hypothetical protein